MKWYLQNGKVSKPYPTLFGYKRKHVLIVSGIVAFVAVALVVGLAVGLSLRHKNQPQPIPIPGDTTQIFAGELTYYAPGLGACGVTSTAEDPICAISHILWDSAQQGTDPNNNPYCGRKIRATRLQEGQTQNSTIDVTVVDRCVGCGVYDLDFSPTAFSMLANETLGRVDVSWWFLD